MITPNQPVRFIPRPFASEGTYKDIPETKEANGRASFADGFPTETQLPMTQGGIAPNRMDFNGILNLLTDFGFWQQSGGMWAYQTELNYKKPNMVFHNNVLWWCVADNGPGTKANCVEPGTNAAYWIDLVTLIKQMGAQTGTSISGVPVGGIVMFPVVYAPEGFLPCDGSYFSPTAYPQLHYLLGKTNTPDMRGLFVRGYDPTGANDADGVGRSITTYQGDAIRDIVGNFGFVTMHAPHATGPFNFVPNGWSGRGGETTTGALDFFASRVVPTANENRPKNINLLYCIKHD